MSRKAAASLMLLLLSAPCMAAQEPQSSAQQWEELGRSRMASGDLAGAEEAFSRALSRKSESIRLLRVLSGLALKRGDAEQAWQYLATARRLAPNSPQVVLDFAEVSLIHGYFAEASTAARLLLLIEPDRSEYLYLLGRALFQSSNFPKARETLLEYLEAEPEDGAARLVLAAAHYQDGEYREAREQLSLAGKNGADPAESDYYRAMIAYSVGDDDSALRHFESALRVAPQHGRARLGLAKLLFRQGKTEAALDHLEAAAESLSDESDVYFQLSRVLARLDRRAEAREALGRYRELKAAREERFRISNSLPFTVQETPGESSRP